MVTHKSDLDRAIRLAVSAHAGQRDKAGQPYILHPLRVMLALGPAASEAARVAAVLHDVVEDTDVALLDIELMFGATVADAVDAVTRREGEPYRAFVARAAAHPIGRLVKVADVRDNLGRLAALAPEVRGSLEERYRWALDALEDAAPECRDGEAPDAVLTPEGWRVDP